MAFFVDDALEGAAGVALGVGVGLVAGMMIPAVGSVARPAAKGALKRYLSLSERIKEGTAEAREQLSDLLAEARSELDQEHAQSGNGSKQKQEGQTAEAHA
jgi:hypothetical protein